MVLSKRRSTVRDKVESIIREHGCTYLEALSHFMQENSFSPSRMSKSICPYLFEKLQEELRYTRVVPGFILEKFYKDGRLKMDTEQAIENGKIIQERISCLEKILQTSREKRKCDKEDSDGDYESEGFALIYENKIEEEIEYLIGLSIFCSKIAGE